MLLFCSIASYSYLFFDINQTVNKPEVVFEQPDVNPSQHAEVRLMKMIIVKLTTIFVETPSR